MSIICLILNTWMWILRSREQRAFDECRDVTLEYPIAENEGEEDNTYLSYNMVAGNARGQPDGIWHFEVLDYALLSAPGAPLKQALLDAEHGKGYSMALMMTEFSSHILQ